MKVNIQAVAEQVLDEKGQEQVDLLLSEGRIEEARFIVADAVDDYREENPSEFLEAMTYYNWLNLPTWRAALFVQIHGRNA